MNSHKIGVTQNVTRAAVCRTARICNQLRQHLSYESDFFFTHVQRANRPGERMNWQKYFGKCGSRVRTIKNKERWPCLTSENIFMGKGLGRKCLLVSSGRPRNLRHGHYSTFTPFLHRKFTFLLLLLLLSGRWG